MASVHPLLAPGLGTGRPGRLPRSSLLAAGGLTQAGGKMALCCSGPGSCSSSWKPCNHCVGECMGARAVCHTYPITCVSKAGGPLINLQVTLLVAGYLVVLLRGQG